MEEIAHPLLHLVVFRHSVLHFTDHHLLPTLLHLPFLLDKKICYCLKDKRCVEKLNEEGAKEIFTKEKRVISSTETTRISKEQERISPRCGAIVARKLHVP